MSARLLMHQMQHLGIHTMVHFFDASKALEWLKQNSCELVLTDWQMHPMSGANFVRQTRLMELGKQYRTRIIAITAGAMPSDYQECMDAGVDDYLTKPLSISMLSQCLKKWGIL